MHGIGQVDFKSEPSILRSAALHSMAWHGCGHMDADSVQSDYSKRRTARVPALRSLFYAPGIRPDQLAAWMTTARALSHPERSVPVRVFRLQLGLPKILTLVCVCARVVKARDLAAGTGREDVLNDLYSKVERPNRPQCRFLTPRLKRSSNRSCYL